MRAKNRWFHPLVLVSISILSIPGAATADPGHEGHGEKAAATAETPAAHAFARLKGLAGTWKGTAGPEGGEAAETTQTIRVASAGSVVMETLFPGTEHEMINMYYLEGDDLVVTHYCAAGNQPKMRLAEVSEDGRTLHFAFVGGSNLDPAVDGHIHEGSVTLVDEDTVEESWAGYSQGEPAHTMKFHLERAE